MTDKIEFLPPADLTEILARIDDAESFVRDLMGFGTAFAYTDEHGTRRVTPSDVWLPPEENTDD